MTIETGLVMVASFILGFCVCFYWCDKEVKERGGFADEVKERDK